MKRFTFTLLIALSLTCAFGQQEAQFTQYMQNYFLVNPAEGGTEEFINLQAGYRSQWLGLDGAPATYFISWHSPLGKKTSRFDDIRQRAFHGVGGYVMKDEIGPSSRTSAFGSYAYHLPVSAHNDLVISVGVNFGIKQFQLDGDQITFYSEEYGGKDDNAISGAQSTYLPDATAGIWAYSNDYFLGISAFQLLQNQVSFYVADESTGDVSVEQDRLEQHFFLTGGYKFHMTEDLFIVPSAVLKWVSPAPLQIDLNTKIRYKHLAWAGVSYRHEDALIGMIGGTVLNGHLDMSYSYDFNTSNLNNFNSGSHEILVGYNIPYQEQPPPPSQFW